MRSDLAPRHPLNAALAGPIAWQIDTGRRAAGHSGGRPRWPWSGYLRRERIKAAAHLKILAWPCGHLLYTGSHSPRFRSDPLLLHRASRRRHWLHAGMKPVCTATWSTVNMLPLPAVDRAPPAFRHRQAAARLDHLTTTLTTDLRLRARTTLNALSRGFSQAWRGYWGGLFNASAISFTPLSILVGCGLPDGPTVASRSRPFTRNRFQQRRPASTRLPRPRWRPEPPQTDGRRGGETPAAPGVTASPRWVQPTRSISLSASGRLMRRMGLLSATGARRFPRCPGPRRADASPSNDWQHDGAGASALACRRIGGGAPCDRYPAVSVTVACCCATPQATRMPALAIYKPLPAHHKALQLSAASTRQVTGAGRTSAATSIQVGALWRRLKLGP